MTAPEATSPAPTATSTPKKKTDRAPASGTTSRNGATSRPAPPPDTLAAAATPAPVVEAPLVTVQLSAEQRSIREMGYRDDTARAAKALDGVRTRVLTPAQRDQLGSADRFLADAVAAFDAQDLVRASSLAQKARILAEELRAAVAP